MPDTIEDFFPKNVLKDFLDINSKTNIINLAFMRFLSLYHSDFFEAVHTKSEDDTKTFLWSIFIELALQIPL